MKLNCSLVLLSIALPGLALGQNGPGRLAEQTIDPVSNLMQIAFFNDVDLEVGEARENDLRLTVQPQLPLRLVEGLNVIVWSVLSFRSAPPPGPEDDRLNGIGDTVVRLLLAPSSSSPWRWGLGPAALVPTATRNALGSTAFGLGGAGIVRYQGGPWTGGLLVQHLSSVREAVGRPQVHRSAIRPFFAFTTPSGVSLGLDSETVVDWESPKKDRWLVPIQPTVGQVARVGGQHVNLQIGGRYYAASPAGGPTWGLRLLVTLLFPVEPGPPEGGVARTENPNGRRRYRWSPADEPRAGSAGSNSVRTDGSRL